MRDTVDCVKNKLVNLVLALAAIRHPRLLMSRIFHRNRARTAARKCSILMS